PLIKEETKARESSEKAITKTVKAREKELITLEKIDELLNEGRYQEDIDADRDAKEVSDITRLIDRSLSERQRLINDAERLGEITEQEANEQRIIAEIDHLQRLKKLRVQYGLDVTEINEQISSSQLSLSKAVNKEIQEVEKNTINSLANQVTESTKVIVDFYKDAADQAIQAQN